MQTTSRVHAESQIVPYWVDRLVGDQIKGNVGLNSLDTQKPSLIIHLTSYLEAAHVLNSHLIRFIWPNKVAGECTFRTVNIHPSWRWFMATLKICCVNVLFLMQGVPSLCSHIAVILCFQCCINFQVIWCACTRSSLPLNKLYFSDLFAFHWIQCSLGSSMWILHSIVWMSHWMQVARITD